MEFEQKYVQIGFVLSEAAGLLATWMDELNVGQATLVGHSMGGFIVADLYLPDSRLVIIEGAGHNPMWDRPEEFNQALYEFLVS